MTLHRSTRLLLVTPAIVYLVALTQAPFLLTLYYSLHKWILTSPELGVTFTGLDNYAYTLLHDATFRAAVFNLLLITGGIIVCSLVLGMLLALLLHRSFPLQPLARSLAITPFFVMPTVNAVVWKNLLLNPIFGFVSWLTTSVGLPRVDILATYPKLGIITIAVWQWTPFMMLILLAGLQSRPLDVVEAARMDGANAWQIFTHMTMPHLRQYIELAGLLGTIYVVQNFDHVFTITSGGLGTANLPYYIYQTFYTAHDYGLASAAGVIVVVLTIIVATVALRTVFSLFKEESR